MIYGYFLYQNFHPFPDAEHTAGTSTYQLFNVPTRGDEAIAKCVELTLGQGRLAVMPTEDRAQSITDSGIM